MVWVTKDDVRITWGVGFFSTHIRFFLACEEKKTRKKKCEKKQSEEKSKKSEEKASILSDFRIVRVKNPASKHQKCE